MVWVVRAGERLANELAVSSKKNAVLAIVLVGNLGVERLEHS